MDRPVIWKDRALEQVRETVEYLVAEFSVGSAEKFLDRIDEKIERIQKYPTSGQATRFKTVRRVRLDKHRSLFYRAHGRKIIVLFCWDGRQEPSKNPYR